MNLEVVWWAQSSSGALEGVGYVDQRALPGEYVRAVARDVADVVTAIAALGVRGAPCIGVFAAYGVALARERHSDDAQFAAAAGRIRAARPTAVNLAWAVDRVLAAPGRELAEAREIHAEQLAVDRAIGEYGAALMPAAGMVLTHCNTGPLATAGLGTALAVIVAAHAAGKDVHVIVDETRPLLQGARLTTYELARAGVPATLIVDGAAAATMRAKNVKAVIVGADRIARNGDTANKIGTYGVAIAARYHEIPFYVAAPRSTIDFSIADGRAIAIEERAPAEVRRYAGAATAPADTSAYNPAFDVTPAALVAGIITEYGVARPPYETSLGELAGREILRVHR
jgi:methylthioribose-1-phosphate isomerase